MPCHDVKKSKFGHPVISRTTTLPENHMIPQASNPTMKKALVTSIKARHRSFSEDQKNRVSTTRCSMGGREELDVLNSAVRPALIILSFSTRVLTLERETYKGRISTYSDWYGLVSKQDDNKILFDSA